MNARVIYSFREIRKQIMHDSLNIVHIVAVMASKDKDPCNWDVVLVFRVGVKVGICTKSDEEGVEDYLIMLKSD